MKLYEASLRAPTECLGYLRTTDEIEAGLEILDDALDAPWLRGRDRDTVFVAINALRWAIGEGNQMSACLALILEKQSLAGYRQGDGEDRP